MSDMSMQVPMMSRSGTSSALGKLTEELKIRLSYATMEGLRRNAAEHDMPLAEYVRIKLDCDVHGADQVANVAVERIRRVAGTGV